MTHPCVAVLIIFNTSSCSGNTGGVQLEGDALFSIFSYSGAQTEALRTVMVFTVAVGVAKEGNDPVSEWEAKARTAKNDMEEAGGRECEESLVENRGSCRWNEMGERCESNRGEDKVYQAVLFNKI